MKVVSVVEPRSQFIKSAPCFVSCGWFAQMGPTSGKLTPAPVLLGGPTIVGKDDSMATRIANVILAATSAVVFGLFCYLVGLHGWSSTYLVLLMLIAGLLLALRLRPALRVNAVMMLMALGMSLYISELVLAARDDLASIQKQVKWLPFNAGEDKFAIVARYFGYSL